MKRNAREIEGDTPKAKGKDGPKETKSEPKPASKRVSINREEIAKIMMAQSQAARQATLGLPFQPREEVGKEVPAPKKSQSVSVQSLVSQTSLTHMPDQSQAARVRRSHQGTASSLERGNRSHPQIHQAGV